MADETYEQFEERVLNKRAAAMYHLVRAKLQLSPTIPFSDMTHRNNKKQVRHSCSWCTFPRFYDAMSENLFLNLQVAQKFYTLLVLKKNQALELSQIQSYAEIMISQGKAKVFRI